MKRQKAKIIRCKRCGIGYLETWDDEKCPHKPIADVIPEIVKVLKGGKSEFVTKNE